MENLNYIKNKNKDVNEFKVEVYQNGVLVKK